VRSYFQAVSSLRLFVFVLPVLVLAHQLLTVFAPCMLKLILPSTLRTMLALL
jgi:hypothetical protein